MSSDATTGTPLHGCWLLVVRLIWFVVTFLALGIFITGIPVRYEQLLTAVPEAVRAYKQLSPAAFTALQQLGISINFYATYITALEIIFTFAYSAIAVVIFWRKSNEGFIIFVSLTVILIGVTTPTVDSALAAQYPFWRWPIEVLQALGVAAILIMFYLFPDGHFVPGWTRPLALIWSGLVLVWLLFPSVPFNVIYGATFDRTPVLSILVATLWFGTGVFAQIYRYRRISSPVQRQQTKWVVFGFVTVFLSGIIHNSPPAILPLFPQPAALLVDHLLASPLVVLLALVWPISVAFSILRYRLWDINIIINLTTVYTLLTASLGLVYLGSVALFQAIFRPFIVDESNLTVFASALLVAALFQPWRRRIQAFIDRLTYRETVDFQQAFTELSRELRTIIDLPELLQVLVTRITDLLHSQHGAIFLYDSEGQLQLEETHRLSQGEALLLPLNSQKLDQLRGGVVISQISHETWPLLLPLTAPGSGQSDLVGLLALGPRLSGQPYSRQDRALLAGLASQAGTMIFIVQLFEAERQLEAYRNSPLGQAERMAHKLLDQPETALIELHRLIQRAERDVQAASLIKNLPQVLNNLGVGSVARLAEGFSHLYDSQASPDRLMIGLRTLTSQLETSLQSKQNPADNWVGAAETLAVYRLCQITLTVKAISQIVQLWSLLQKQGSSATANAASIKDGSEGEQKTFLAELSQSLAGMQPVIEALSAYERVRRPEDKSFYLAQAIENLAGYNRQLAISLSLPERLILQQVIEHWTRLVTEELQALQGRAQLEVTVITRQVVAAERMALALKLTNLGRSPASNVVVELQPEQGYEVIEGRASIDQIRPGHQVQMQFTVQPRATEQFQPIFEVRYDDRERPSKTQTVATTVYLLLVPAAAVPIPNPYEPGQSLRQGSPVFFGREDIFAFIRETIAGSTAGRALVLTGQRRMGKTSLLKQLPARLGDEYVTVFLDAQSLAIDPGMPSFFYDLALEIADTLELDSPSLDAFQTRPSAVFEREFLPQALHVVGQRRLLLLFDEFEELEMRVAGGKLESDLFSFLRHLMQHADQLAFVFVGTHRLEQLNPTYWSAFFNVALHRRVSFLEAEAARKLITKPVASHLVYDDLALDKMLRATAGHPYFLQLLCHVLVSEANQERRNYIELDHVNQALDQVLELGEAHFIFLWNQLTLAEQVVLTAAASLSAENETLTREMLTSQLQASGRFELTQENVVDILTHLVQREVIRPVEESDAAYAFVLELLQLWVRRN